MRACCPFHEETQPSFYVDPAGGFYKCFGCGAGGDVFAFLMQIEGMTFPEAAERLAEMAGIQWKTSREASKEAGKAGRQREYVRRVNRLTLEYFQDCLHGPVGMPGLGYLTSRGIREAAIQRFGLGFAPDSWDGLVRFLASKGVDGKIAEHCGVVKARSGGGHYDAFRNRVMFPIIEVNGQVIAFGGRALDPDENAKYINSPETALFKKSRTVYGLNLARTTISETNQVLVVEGYTDVIAVSEAGIRNVVACLGTATTPDHLRLLGRYADEIVFVYDGDAAGMKAALRHIEIFEQASADVKVAVLPAGKDPDEVIKEIGVEGFRKCIDERLSLVEYQLRMIFSRHEANGADDRTGAVREAVQVLARVPGNVRRNDLLARAADWWGQNNPQRTEAMQRILTEELRKLRPTHGRSEKIYRRGLRDRDFITDALTRTVGGQSLGAMRLAAAMLSAAMCDREFAVSLQQSSIEAADFVDTRDRTIFGYLMQYVANAEEFSSQDIIAILTEDECVRERALELWMAEVDLNREREVLAQNVAKLKRDRAERQLSDECSHILEAVEAGKLAYDSPEYQDFKQRFSRLHGASGKGFYPYQGDWGVPRSDSDRGPAGATEPADGEGS